MYMQAWYESILCPCKLQSLTSGGIYDNFKLMLRIDKSLKSRPCEYVGCGKLLCKSNIVQRLVKPHWKSNYKVVFFCSQLYCRRNSNGYIQQNSQNNLLSAGFVAYILVGFTQLMPDILRYLFTLMLPICNINHIVFRIV